MPEQQLIEIENLDAVLAKLGPQLVGKPVRDMLTRICLRIEADARANTPVDAGRLRAGITHEVDDAELPTWAVVGSNLEYAPYMEYGTGVFAEGEGASGRRHWPPGDALDLWAERHGFESGAQVAAIIGRRGGLEPRRFLRNAVEANQGFIEGEIADCANDIGQLWSAP